MTQIPLNMLQKRSQLAAKYLCGNGIEIGALDAPLDLPAQAKVRYVDRMPVHELRLQYPELASRKLVDVDIVDDGESLGKIEDDSLDFLVANHMLEHCENPLGTLRNALRKLKKDGILYCSIPDKWQSFDIERNLTTFEHLINDDKDSGAASKFAHYVEWARFVAKSPDAEVEESALRNMQFKYSIHFHVWDESSFHEFLNQSKSYLNNIFEILQFERNGTEVVAILRKQ